MRALVIGLIGAVLGISGAAAGPCRAAHMSLKRGSAVLKVERVSQADVTFGGRRAQRVLFAGRLHGQPYIIDLNSAQGSSAFLNSYAGTRADGGGMPVRWTSSIKQYGAGDLIPVEVGPLQGEWKVSCR
jgi:hypothetical protein